MANAYLPSTLKPKEQLQAVQLSPTSLCRHFFIHCIPASYA